LAWSAVFHRLQIPQMEWSARRYRKEGQLQRLVLTSTRPTLLVLDSPTRTMEATGAMEAMGVMEVTAIGHPITEDMVDMVMAADTMEDIISLLQQSPSRRFYLISNCCYLFPNF
jgi:ABC-type molybdenum transport system ATPase subunit/photorepair protein PhrA